MAKGLFQSTPSSRRATALHHADMQATQISIHALLTEGDFANGGKARGFCEFQSTPSSRRATAAGRASRRGGTNFNPRPPHGGRLVMILSTGNTRYFNPRPPHGGRQIVADSVPVGIPISIHALLTEGDFRHLHAVFTPFNFNPRPPHGGRPG